MNRRNNESTTWSSSRERRQDRTVKYGDARQQLQADLSNATSRAQQWNEDGHTALKDGNQVWAEVCFGKALYWRDKANELKTKIGL